MDQVPRVVPDGIYLTTATVASIWGIGTSTAPATERVSFNIKAYADGER